MRKIGFSNKPVIMLKILIKSDQFFVNQMPRTSHRSGRTSRSKKVKPANLEIADTLEDYSKENDFCVAVHLSSETKRLHFKSIDDSVKGIFLSKKKESEQPTITLSSVGKALHCENLDGKVSFTQNITVKNAMSKEINCKKYVCVHKFCSGNITADRVRVQQFSKSNQNIFSDGEESTNFDGDNGTIHGKTSVTVGHNVSFGHTCPLFDFFTNPFKYKTTLTSNEDGVVVIEKGLFPSYISDLVFWTDVPVTFENDHCPANLLTNYLISAPNGISVSDYVLVFNNLQGSITCENFVCIGKLKKPSEN